MFDYIVLFFFSSWGWRWRQLMKRKTHKKALYSGLFKTEKEKDDFFFVVARERHGLIKMIDFLITDNFFYLQMLSSGANHLIPLQATPWCVDDPLTNFGRFNFNCYGRKKDSPVCGGQHSWWTLCQRFESFEWPLRMCRTGVTFHWSKLF